MSTVPDKHGSRGVAMGDLDGDHYPEIVVANQLSEKQPSGNPVYLNERGNQFQTRTSALDTVLRWSEGVSLVDVDGDSDLDIFFASQFNQTNPLFLNDGSGNFSITEAGDLSSERTNSTGSCWCDYDLDGDLDVFVVNRDGEDDALYINNGQGLFRREVKGPWIRNGGDGRSCAWGDFNADGWSDLLVINFVRKVNGEVIGKHRNFLYWNRGSSDFEAERSGVVVEDEHASYGVSVVDVDYDHDLDIYVTNVSISDENVLYINDGRGEFKNLNTSLVAQNTNRPSKGQTWGDFNNDGRIDLYVANGTEGYPEIQNFLFLGKAGGDFERVDNVLPAVDRHISAGVASGDLDCDGDLDLYVCNWGGEAEVNDLYVNELNASNWIKLRLKGIKSNSRGVGSWITIKTDDGIQTRYFASQTGYGSQNSDEIHFGLGPSNRVKELEIEWPGGSMQKFEEVEGNHLYLITELFNLTRIY